MKEKLPDTQNEKDIRGKFIDKVGIRNFKIPFKILTKNNTIQNTVGTVSVYGSLNEEVRGTNMSRFAQTIMKALEHESVSIKFIEEVLKVLSDKLQCEDNYIKIRFPYFIKYKSPISDNYSFNNYDCELEGHRINNVTKIYLTVKIHYTSLCPCSKNMSAVAIKLPDVESVGKGAHNQRSFCKVKILLKDFVWIEDLVNIVEKNASCKIYNILKREDEKYVTEKAYSNPKFVEDMSRDIALELDRLNCVGNYVIVNEHEESIHQYNAVSVLKGGLE